MEDNDEIRFAVQGKAGCGIWVTRLQRSFGSLHWIHDLFLVSDLQICLWDGSSMPVEGESLLPDSDYTWSRGLTGFGLEDRWVYGTYEYGFDDTQCHTGFVWACSADLTTPWRLGQLPSASPIAWKILAASNIEAMWVRSFKTSDLCWLKPHPHPPRPTFGDGPCRLLLPRFFQGNVRGVKGKERVEASFLRFKTMGVRNSVGFFRQKRGRRYARRPDNAPRIHFRLGTNTTLSFTDRHS